MHLLIGSVGFLALIVACFVFARRFASLDQRAWMAYSVVTGIVVVAAIAGISSGSQQALSSSRCSSAASSAGRGSQP
jgi:hypothetical protein